MMTVNKWLMLIIAGIGLFVAGLLEGKHLQSVSDDLKSKEVEIANLKHLVSTQEYQLSLSESINYQSIHQIEELKRKYNNEVIARHKDHINTNNHITIDWVRLMESTAPLSTDTSRIIATNESISAYEVLEHERGLREHDETCVTKYNLLLNWYELLRNKP
jgi:hypothetical protein